MVEALALAAYSHRGTQAVQRMVEFAPSTGGLALWVAHRDVAAGVPVAGASTHAPHHASLQAPPPAPPVSTDGHTLRYDPAFARLPLPEQTGLVAHGVLHIALRHPQRFLALQQLLGDCDLQLFNTCADAIVNSTLSHLSWLQLPAGAVRLEQLLLQALTTEQTVEKSLLEWDVERLYRAIDDRRVSGNKGRREDGPRAARVRALGSRSPIDLLPAPGLQGPPEADAEAAREWSERLLRGHAGDGEFSMLRTLLADLPKSRTPWEQVLRTRLARALAPRRSVSWSRPARSYIANQGRIGAHGRLPWEPGWSAGQSVPRLALVVDVSGSIDDALMGRFAREIEALTRRLEAGLVLVVGDDRVRRVEHYAPGRAELGAFEFDGGGGTDFTPLLEEADRHRPDIGVVLTDLEGPARFQPRWPVIWAVPVECEHALQPFGRKLVLA